MLSLFETQGAVRFCLPTNSSYHHHMYLHTSTTIHPKRTTLTSLHRSDGGSSAIRRNDGWISTAAWMDTLAGYKQRGLVSRGKMGRERVRPSYWK